MKKQIIDCFTFFNELELLEFRLTELDPYVDKFVIVESTKTFTGKPKPLFYKLNKFKFKQWEHKIIHKVVYDMPVSLPQEEIDKLVDLPEIRDIHWVREHHQRRQIGKVLENLNLDYEDVILISDLDEIPDLSKSNQFIDLLKFGPVVFKQDWYIWNLHNIKNSDWVGTSAFYYSHYISNKDIFQKIRNIRWDGKNNDFSIVQNGWHFSWFGNQEFIKQKMFSFAHTETANDYFKDKDNITYLVENSLPPQVPHDDTPKLNYVDLDPSKLPTNYELIPNYFSEKVRVFDCFMLFNEIDILNLRLEELNQYVDFFIIIESQKTHSGKDKELFYEKHKDQFKKFEDKIIYVIIEDLPNELPNNLSNLNLDINWYRENFQRNQIKTALMELGVNDKDIIMISDVDEIPDLEDRDLKSIVPDDNFVTCVHKWFHWNFDWEHNGSYWPGTQLMRYQYLKTVTPQEVRDQRYDESKLAFREVWGWHLSWFGTIEEIQYKLKSFAHQEIPNYNDEEIRYKIENGFAMVKDTLVRTTDNYYPNNKSMMDKKIKITNILIDFE